MKATSGKKLIRSGKLSVMIQNSSGKEEKRCAP